MDEAVRAALEEVLRPLVFEGASDALYEGEPSTSRTRDIPIVGDPRFGWDEDGWNVVLVIDEVQRVLDRAGLATDLRLGARRLGLDARWCDIETWGEFEDALTQSARAGARTGADPPAGR